MMPTTRSRSAPSGSDPSRCSLGQLWVMLRRQRPGVALPEPGCVPRPCPGGSPASTVRIRDRRLGIPYITFLVLIFLYNIFILVIQKKYLKEAPVDGVTRLQVRRAAVPVIGFTTVDPRPAEEPPSPAATPLASGLCRVSSPNPVITASPSRDGAPARV